MGKCKFRKLEVNNCYKKILIYFLFFFVLTLYPNFTFLATIWMYFLSITTLPPNAEALCNEHAARSENLSCQVVLMVDDGNLNCKQTWQTHLMLASLVWRCTRS